MGRTTRVLAMLAAVSAAALQLTVLGTGAVLFTSGTAIADPGAPDVRVVIRSGRKMVARGTSDKNGEITFMLKPGRYSVLIGETELPIVISVRHRGVKVTVMAKKHNYVGHVTLLR